MERGGRTTPEGNEREVMEKFYRLILTLTVWGTVRTFHISKIHPD